MPHIHIKPHEISKPVVDFLLKKQFQFKTQKGGRTIGIARTIEKLLKDAYNKEIEELKLEK